MEGPALGSNPTGTTYTR